MCSACLAGRICLKPAIPAAPPAPLPTSRHRRVCSDEGGKLSPFLPPEIFQKLQVAESQNSKKELTPLEKASLQNQKLRATYEARMARLDPSQAMQKTSLVSKAQRGTDLLREGSSQLRKPYFFLFSLDPVSTATDDGESGDRQSKRRNSILTGS